MNPRFTYMPYGAQQYQYRLPAPAPYCVPYFHPEIGMQYVYVQPYPQMPIIQYDPYSCVQSVPPVMLRPPYVTPAPTQSAYAYRPPLVRQRTSNVRMTRPPRAQHYANQPARSATADNATAQIEAKVMSGGEKKTESASSQNIDRKPHPRCKDGRGDAPTRSAQQPSAPTKKATRKRRTKRPKKTRKSKFWRSMANTNSREQSTDSHSTQARSNREFQGRDDDEYETCDDENDLDPMPGNRCDKDEKSVGQVLRDTGETVASKPPLPTASKLTTHYMPIYPVNEDYWAAVSGIESIWNPSDESTICQSTRGNINCKCKQCSKQSAKLHVPPTPELWWDRSTGMELWPDMCNDKKSGANTLTNPGENPTESARCVLTDKNQNYTGGAHETIGGEAVTNAVIDNGIPKRRLLSVDWSSISTSNVDGNTMRTNSIVENRIKSITEFDSAILERGPLATESFAIPAIAQPSVSGTLLKSVLPNSEDLRINALRGQTTASGIQGYFQTAFTSQDNCKLNDPENDGVESTSNVKTSVDGKPPKTDDGNDGVPNSPANWLEAKRPKKFGASPTAQLLEATAQVLQATVMTSGSHPEETESPNVTVGFQKQCDVPGENSCAAAIDSVLDKIKEDTDIPPDSIENASAEVRKGIAAELQPNRRSGFLFPRCDEIFRERVDADSGSPDDRDGESVGVTVNKKIYENSKPTPCTTDDLPVTGNMIRTEPSSPVASKGLVSTRSFSLNDLRKASEAKKPAEIHRLDKKPPLAPAPDLSIQGKPSKGRSNADKKGTSNENVSKTVKPKRPWKQNPRPKYPTGIPLNSMLNDTIRRNFRQRASPVTIFGLYRPPADTNFVSSRQPSIDDWSEVMVGPVPVGTYCVQQTLSSSDHGSQAEAQQHDHALDSHYIPIPVVLYPSTSTIKPRIYDNPGRPRTRRQAIKRWNSFTTVSQASATQTRKIRFHEHGSAKTLDRPVRREHNKTKSNTATSVAKSKPDNNKLKTSTERFDNVYTQTQVQTGRPTNMNSATLKHQDESSHRSGNDTGNMRNVSNHSLEASRAPVAREHGKHEPVELKDAPPVKDKKNSIEDEQRSVDHGGKRLKESFLKRVMKRKKWNRQTMINETKVTHRDDTADSLYHPKTKPSRQEKIRANITSKKNRLLGRGNKARLRGLSSFGTEDCNANRSRNAIEAAESTEFPTTIRKGHLRMGESGNGVPREDRNLKRALYRPTLVGIAPIEIETRVHPEKDLTSLTTSDRNISVKDRHARLLDADSSLPAPINQGREERSAAGTPGVRINSETGDVIETSDVKLMSTFLCSTKIVENENIHCES